MDPVQVVVNFGRIPPNVLVSDHKAKYAPAFPPLRLQLVLGWPHVNSYGECHVIQGTCVRYLCKALYTSFVTVGPLTIEMIGIFLWFTLTPQILMILFYMF